MIDAQSEKPPIVSQFIPEHLSQAKMYARVDSSKITLPDTFEDKPAYLQQFEAQKLSEGTIRFINFVVGKDIDTIFFLDKSARPAYHLARKVWEQLYVDKPFPDVRFINVGRSDKHSPSSDLNAERIAELKNEIQGFSTNNVLIADECVSHGESMLEAQWLLMHTFPEIKHLDYASIYSDPPSWINQREVHAVVDPAEDKNPFITQRSATDIAPILQHRDELESLANSIVENTQLEDWGDRNLTPLVLEKFEEKLREREKVIRENPNLNIKAIDRYDPLPEMPRLKVSLQVELAKAARSGDKNLLIALLRKLDDVAANTQVHPQVGDPRFHGHFNTGEDDESEALERAVMEFIQAIKEEKDYTTTLKGSRCTIDLTTVYKTGLSLVTIKPRSSFAPVLDALNQAMSAEYMPDLITDSSSQKA